MDAKILIFPVERTRAAKERRRVLACAENATVQAVAGTPYFRITGWTSTEAPDVVVGGMKYDLDFSHLANQRPGTPHLIPPN